MFHVYDVKGFLLAEEKKQGGGGGGSAASSDKKDKGSGGPWACDTCTLLNEDVALECEACGSGKYGVTVIVDNCADNKAGKKKQRKGTAIAAAAAIAGGASGSSALPAAAAVGIGKGDDGWACPQCTFVNLHIHSQCDACGAARGGLPGGGGGGGPATASSSAATKR